MGVHSRIGHGGVTPEGQRLVQRCPLLQREHVIVDKADAPHTLRKTTVLSAIGYLGLGAGAVGGEGVLPLWQTQVGDHQPVVGRERCGQKVPAERSVEEPHFTPLSDHTWKTQTPSGALTARRRC